MSKESFNVVERHLEKGVLGLCAVFVLFMFYMYFISQPNRVEFGGEKLGPGELAQKVLADARQLESAMQSKRAEEPKIEKFSQRLRAQHDEGIFVASTGEAPRPPVPETLARAASFGLKTEIPGMENVDEAPASITLVTPLPPSKPEVRTGRSLAIQRQLEPTVSGAQPAAAAAPIAPPEPAETAWVSVAAYFPKSAQYGEMTRAGYATWRARVYVADVEVQRQELLASGTDWSEWAPVSANKAMPRIDIAEPVFDERGELLNKSELDQSFQLVKQEQNLIMQAPFFSVADGDAWEVPPIAGFEEELGEDDEIEKYVELPQKDASGTPTVARQPVGGFEGRSGRGSRGGTLTYGGGRSPVGRIGATGDNPAERRRAARAQIQTLFSEAEQAYRDKQYEAVKEKMRQVVQVEFAHKGDESRANKLYHRAVKRQEREMKLAGINPAQAQAPQPMPGPIGARGNPSEGAPPMILGGRTPDRMAMPGAAMTYSAAQQAPAQLIRHSETNDPAVWFHDDTVVAGKTYRYRMRVNLWNRYVAQMRAMKDPEEAKTAVVPGEWSEPSDPVTVTPTTYFFVKSGRIGTQTAGVDVWRWYQGRWLRERFDVGVGDTIGAQREVKVPEFDEEGKQIRKPVDFATDAVILDIRPDEKIVQRVRGKDGTFTMNEKSTTVVVYLDPRDGQVKEKSQLNDAYDPVLKRLEEEEG